MTLKKRFERYIYIAPAIRRLEQKVNEAYGTYCRSTVQSSNGPGYTLINESIGGYDNLAAEQERIQDMRAQVEQLGLEKEAIEHMIDSVSDLRIRQILSLRYLDGRRWNEVVAALGSRESESSVKMATNRYFKKFCDECDQSDGKVIYNKHG